MAHDLILGRTSRDWSCGGAAPAPAPERPWDRLPEAPRMAEATRSEMSRTASDAIRLRKKGLLPEADWRGFSELHRRWLSLSDARRGRWREADALPLWNLREACKIFAEKFAALEKLSRPSSAAPAPSQSLASARVPTLSGPWYVSIGAALALSWTGFFASLRDRRDVP